MLTLLLCSTSYTVLIVLWKVLMELVNALARWWHFACLKCFSGLRRLEISLNFLRCIHVFDLVLKYGSDINEGIWLQLLFYFFVLVGTVTAVIGISFFFSRVSCFRLMYSSIALWQKRLHLDSKSDLTTNGIIFGFFVGKWLFSLTSYLYGLKSARDAQLFFYFDDINFFRCLGWGVFWSIL